MTTRTRRVEGTSCALLFAALLAVTTSALAGGYVYEGIVTGLSLQLNVERQAVAVGESVYDATYCAKSEAFRCFDSQVLAFAVPKSELVLGRTWNVRGLTYTLTVPLHTRTILAREYEACVIDSSFEDRGESVFRRFLYSPQSGLLAIEERILSKGRWSGDVYLSRGLWDVAASHRVDVGYGAR